MTKKLEHSLNIAHEAVATQLQARVLQARVFYRLASRGYFFAISAIVVTVISHYFWRVPSFSWESLARLWVAATLILIWWNLRRMCKIIENLYSPHILRCPMEEAERIAALATPDLLKMTEDNIKIM